MPVNPRTKCMRDSTKILPKIFPRVSEVYLESSIQSTKRRSLTPTHTMAALFTKSHAETLDDLKQIPLDKVLGKLAPLASDAAKHLAGGDFGALVSSFGAVAEVLEKSPWPFNAAVR